MGLFGGCVKSHIIFNLPIDLAPSLLLARTPTTEGATKLGKTELTINDLVRFLSGTQY